MLRFAFTSFLTLTLALSLSAADWTRFRGPNGNGTAEGTLPTIDPKAPLWKVEIPGKGAGSPIVSKGKIFLQTGAADGSKRTLLCLDAKTGGTIWAKDLPGKPAPKEKGNALHPKNTMASSTPATDGEFVYCVWWDGAGLILNAYDYAGNEKWSAPLGAYKSEHGAGHSPAVYNGKVFVNFDMDGAANVYAYDAKTGSKAWTAERVAHRASYTTPFLLEQPGKKPVVIVGSTTGIDAYDPDSGKVVWHFTITWPTMQKLRMIGCPVMVGDLLVFYMGEGGNSRYMIAIKPEGSGDISKNAKVWDVNKQCPYVPSMLAKDDLLFWVHDDGRCGCTEAKTGMNLWEETLFGDKVTTSPILVGDTILAISEKGQIALLKPTKEFQIPKKLELGEGSLATPAMVDGRLYIRGTNHLFCFGKK